MFLRKITINDFNAFKDMAIDYLNNGENRYEKYLTENEFSEYLTTIKNYQEEIYIPEGKVPSFSYWLFDENGKMHGGIRFRWKLNDNLLIEGGHIGYDVRPSSRRNGYAFFMVNEIIKIAKTRGLTKLLITCDVDNIASEAVIKKCGGILESIEKSPRTGKMAKRFWISI